MNTLEMLKRGRERVSRGWCKSVLSLNAQGHSTPSDGEAAVKWCAIGALGDGDENLHLRVQAMSLLEKMLPAGYKDRCAYNIVLYNNHPLTKQSDVVSLFDRAIAALEPIQRSTQELVAELMTKVMGERIPEEQKDTINT